MGVIITDKGKPVAKIIRYTEDPSDILKSLRNSVISYDAPTMPVGLEDWEALKSSSGGGVGADVESGLKNSLAKGTF